jgi:ABC-type microcin C transport system duplicated ATPase subunit YejF
VPHLRGALSGLTTPTPIPLARRRRPAAAGLAYLFISHDLAVVRRIAHRVGVLRDGRLLELAPTEQLFATPQHDYTRELLAAIAGRRAELESA